MTTEITGTKKWMEQHAGHQELLREAFDKFRFQLDFGIEEEDEEKAKAKLEARIYAKLEAGKRLSAKELQYLRRNNPALYMQAVRVEQKRKALEHQLEHAKSKEEVQNIFTMTMAGVSEDDPAKRYVIAAIEETVKEFKASDKYKRLPETEEQAKRKKELTYEIGELSYQIAYEEEMVAVQSFQTIS